MQHPVVRFIYRTLFYFFILLLLLYLYSYLGIGQGGFIYNEF
ncbi:TPA: teichoic acid D-Ala incorporation-associated protein DltX [Streptococcus suis]|nr:teichoic acid D-Ala incorporation-associated protein DltX [Streptococcus suis]HEL1737905.1 teichoic acid D-Ala incorporation-associated protein DltX [Streptococcus suis]HEL2331812.1 teichoic acid D-Ala incorporation-associated protein DltX [Streptococcus suis]HEM2695107.1 teichoic acid D-Ala incorporation-associated protein DltX [Streptococcus suis]HEM2709430.1 teichoic acid D-Ala incorporation-associated protein DltX [Streptococcus suis]